MSYQTGALDTTLVNGEQVDQVKDDPEFQAIGAGYLWYVSPNIKNVPELANLNIRMALTMAINREAITTDVLKDGSHLHIQQFPLNLQQVLTDLTSPEISPSSLMYAHLMQIRQQSTGRQVWMNLV